VDQRIASLSGAAVVEPSVVVWASGGLSPLSTDTEEAFAKVFRQLLTLHREVFRQVLFGESGTVAPDA
jgi:molybdopterin-biosynthesis enzyme MoeA-like protein